MISYSATFQMPVLPCTVLYPLADFKEILVSESTVYAGIYRHIPVYPGTYQHVLAHTILEMKAHPYSTSWYVLCCTSMYQYVLVCTD